MQAVKRNGIEKMEQFVTAAEIAECVNGIVEGNPKERVTGVALYQDAAKSDLTFAGRGVSAEDIKDIEAAVIIVPPWGIFSKGKTYIRTASDMEQTLDQVIALFVKKGLYDQKYIEPPFIHETARVSRLCSIGNETFIGAGTSIGDFVSIGCNVRIGAECVIKAGAVIEDGTCIGNHVVINSGARIGTSSFEYGHRDGKWIPIQNIGTVIVEDDVEIGANTTIDRGTIGNTVIGRGTKIDNLVQIGHEAKIGADCKIVAQTAIAGWAMIGNHTVLYGQCGIANHVHIGDHVTVLAKSGVTKNIPDYAVVSGFPACDHYENLKMQAYIKAQIRKKRRK